MTFHAYGFQSIHVMGTPDGTAGSRRKVHSYVTSDSELLVEAADYFLTLTGQLKANDILFVAYLGTPNRTKEYIVESATAATVTIKPAATGARAVVPTVGGLTTGLLRHNEFVTATSANADYILTLPAASAATIGSETKIWVVASTNCELRTPDASGQTINGVDSDGTQEALLTHSQFYIARQITATGWLLQAFTALGAVATPIVPD